MFLGSPLTWHRRISTPNHLPGTGTGISTGTGAGAGAGTGTGTGTGTAKIE